jgi:hypothetical protein
MYFSASLKDESAYSGACPQLKVLQVAWAIIMFQFYLEAIETGAAMRTVLCLVGALALVAAYFVEFNLLGQESRC